MKRNKWKRHALVFFIIFAVNCFVVTCTFVLFMQNLEYTEEQIRASAPFTAVNVVLISVLFVVVYYLINYFVVEKPVRKIQKGLSAVTKGDFSVRIESDSSLFEPIIDSVNQMTEELSSVETLKTDFVSNVSHEIKTPLSVIQNYGQLLQSDYLTDAQRKEYAKTVTDASERLSNLISNILRLNRLENQQLEPKTEHFDLGAQLGECILGFENVWSDKDIELDLGIPDDIVVTNDKELLSVVWNNLLSNAFKFTENGGTVGVKLSCDGDFATVAVSDTGCGISAESGRHIFDKFYQGDTSHATQGNGLGLALVKRIIDIIGGEISVSSKLGEGTTFTVKLRRDL